MAMRVETRKEGKRTINIREFDSMHEFYDYICNTPINEIFRWSEHHSTTGKKDFTHTNNFQEAVDLFKGGWSDMAKKLEQKLKLISDQVDNKTTVRSQYDVAGFQASVPRYLQGVPISMINQKRVPQKQKVITLNKSITYGAWVSTEKIMEWSTKALQIVKKIEAQGTRVNLNLIYSSDCGGERNTVKIRIKSANERLNISKVAFPLVHPSMLRRLFFRYTEVCPTFTERSYTFGYGSPTSECYLNYPGEYLLPAEIRDIDELIKNLKLS